MNEARELEGFLLVPLESQSLIHIGAVGGISENGSAMISLSHLNKP